MKKATFFIAIMLCCIVFENCSKNKNCESKKIVETNDTIWYFDISNQFYHRLDIDTSYTIVFDGNVCKIGKFEKITSNDSIRTFFNSCLCFEAKSDYAYGCKMHDDLNDLIKELERGKKAFEKFSKISRDNGIKTHVESFATGNPPIFALGSTYHKYDNEEYMEINGITTGNEGYGSFYIYNYKEKTCTRYGNTKLNVKASVKFYSCEQYNNWIKKLKLFKKNKFVKIDKLYK